MREGKATYEIVENRHSTGGPLTIRDVGPWDKYPTVTNAAEETVAELLASGILQPSQRLLYYDSENELDELLVKDGRFAGFAPARAKS